ncbi:hypothetical protein N0V82_003103, partial [Gnomoniopsis sp. IMI 355080]
LQMNLAENIFAKYSSEDIILYVASEGAANVRNVTWKELRSQVARVASAMVSRGVDVGDRIAAVISNRLETIVTCLAALSLGAIWSSSSPDMGVDGILSRLRQIRPKMVFCENRVVYNGKLRYLLNKHRIWAKVLMQETAELEAVVVVGDMEEDLGMEGDKFRSISEEVESQAKLMPWNEFLSKGVRDRKLQFRQLPFNHPGFIVYSSGTTGPPKCIVHTIGGLLLSASKDAYLSYDIQRGDTVLQYTTTAWIMWALVFVSLSFGGKVVVYDGSPMIPDPLVLLRLVEKLQVNVFGTSAKFLSLLKEQGVSPRALLGLSSLRTVVSTGSVLTADVAEWFYDQGFPPHVFLNSTCGGTDLACSLVSGVPTMPLHAGEIQAPSLGMAVDIFDVDDDRGVSIKDTGEAGELVCTQAWPSEPSFFWDDPTGNIYKTSYFTKYAAVSTLRQERQSSEAYPVWNQGDFVSINPVTGGFVIHGRSDGVLNPGGVRFGSAEIYNVVESDPAIGDSICVGQRRDRDADESVILFVQMADGHSFTRAVARRLSDAIKLRLSPRHVPKYMFQVPTIPYTVNGKKVEILVKKIVSGKHVNVSPTVINPECLAVYEHFVDVERASERQQSSWDYRGGLL